MLRKLLIFSIIPLLLIVPVIAFAADFEFTTSCDEDLLYIEIVGKEGEPLQNVDIRTLKELTTRSGFEDRFKTDENGIATIPFSLNTGFVWLSKGGYNDEKTSVQICDVNRVPDWIRQNTAWWVQNKIDENTFLEGMKFLIKEEILIIPDDIGGQRNSVSYEDGKKVPTWVSTTANWWTNGIIDDKTFLDSIQFLVKNRIINLSDEPEEIQIIDDFPKQTFTITENPILKTNQNECPSDYPYRWSDGQCWNLPQDYDIQLECNNEFPYLWSDGMCYNLPECSGEYSYRWSDGQCYNAQECTDSFPYLWRDGQCYNVPECLGEYPFRWSDGMCYNVRECPSDYPYRWSDGQCYTQPECPASHPYRWNDGMCYNGPEQYDQCGSGDYLTPYGFCCPYGTVGGSDGYCYYQ